MRARIPALVIVCLAVALAARSQETPAPRPDFSGTWKLDLERSSLQIEAPDASTFVIDHRDPHWRLERTHVFGGRSDTLSMELTTDGEPMTFSRGGWEVRRRLHWEDAVLVLESTMSRDGRETRVVVRYRVEDGGRTFIAEEHLESGQETHDNLWVFERSTP